MDLRFDRVELERILESAKANVEHILSFTPDAVDRTLTFDLDWLRSTLGSRIRVVNGCRPRKSATVVLTELNAQVSALRRHLKDLNRDCDRLQMCIAAKIREVLSEQENKTSPKEIVQTPNKEIKQEPPGQCDEMKTPEQHTRELVHSGVLQRCCDAKSPDEIKGVSEQPKEEPTTEEEIPARRADVVFWVPLSNDEEQPIFEESERTIDPDTEGCARSLSLILILLCLLYVTISYVLYSQKKFVRRLSTCFSSTASDEEGEVDCEPLDKKSKGHEKNY